MIRLLPFAAVALLAGCGMAPELSVDDAWVRLGAVKGRPAAAYFAVHGGPVDKTIIAITSDVSIRSEMHESMKSGGMMTMAPLASVPVPANTDVVFKPGGRHVMLFDMNPGIVPGGRPVLLTLSFSDGTRVSRKATVFAAGDPAPE
ncbi:copper chaperone PCu(A)C [Sphingomonas sp.]|uniref:copper chaperone PCu(A)C n=1 Tax=Sphingomonas sp. TaxID=28214 RepID=UPI0035BC3518